MESQSKHDVAPALYDEILNAFNGAIATDPKIREVKKRIQDKTATFEDIWTYARQISSHCSKAFTLNLTPSNLPDGVLYWNIAERVVKPIIEYAIDLNAEIYVSIQKIIWERKKIGLIPIKPKVPEDRIVDYLNKLVDSWEADDE